MSSPWWHPERHQDRQAGLRLRAELARKMRGWFWDQGFLEVEPDLLQVSPGNETHLHGLKTKVHDLNGASQNCYLHTSPEFVMKKLLAAGEDKIFALSRVFRDRESGPLHRNEFTMLEWYRAQTSYEEAMSDCGALLSIAATVRGLGHVSYKDAVCDLSLEPERISVQDAFQKIAKLDLLETLGTQPDRGDRDALVEAAGHLNIQVSETDTWSDLFSKLLTAFIEPNLGIDRPTILYNYPLPEAALARPSPDDPRLGERFEVYCCGIELANGFGELTDAEEQRRRFEAQMQEKQNIYGERDPIDDSFLDALAVMPESSGVALGFDRLAMLTAGATRLDQVVWTPSTHRSDESGNTQ